MICTPSEPIFQELEIVVNAGLMIVEVFVIKQRSFNWPIIDFEPVCNGDFSIFLTIPGQVIAKENPGNADIGQFRV